ncbi:hypothetical protein [Brevundimonas sp.]|uniref:hypothetical protein n=1 Tax=Brevundimonas sp. TaxID=1871086 RepID=UPI002D47D89A|nr:hypothetical protein [Brevundimonas sp.]HYD26955.1 hypothetical protein [Brevundimonas sp.]
MSDDSEDSLAGSGTPENVAYKLATYLKRYISAVRSKDEFLDLYAECLEAAKGRREVKPKP